MRALAHPTSHNCICDSLFSIAPYGVEIDLCLVSQTQLLLLYRNLCSRYKRLLRPKTKNEGFCELRISASLQ